MNIPESFLSSLTDEQKKKVETAQTPEELLAIAQETGYELSPDQLEAVAGGKWCIAHCHPYCDDGHCHMVCTGHSICSRECMRFS